MATKIIRKTVTKPFDVFRIFSTDTVRQIILIKTNYYDYSLIFIGSEGGSEILEW